MTLCHQHHDSTGKHVGFVRFACRQPVPADPHARPDAGHSAGSRLNCYTTFFGTTSVTTLLDVLGNSSGTCSPHFFSAFLFISMLCTLIFIVAWGLGLYWKWYGCNCCFMVQGIGKKKQFWVGFGLKTDGGSRDLTRRCHWNTAHLSNLHHTDVTAANST